MKLVLNQREELSRVLLLEGSDYEQGVQHGRSAAALIPKNVAAAKRWIHASFSGGQGMLDHYYRENLVFLRRERPELMEELQGISAGSGVPLQDIILLNIQLYFALKWIAPECSQFSAIIEDSSGRRRTYAGKNRDNSSGPRESVILMRRYPDGLTMLEVGFAGVVTGPGNVLTNRHVSVTSSGVWAPRLPVDPSDFSCGEVLPDTHRLARNIHSLEDSLEYLEHLPRATGMNYIISIPGQSMLVSLSSKEMLTRAGGHHICATNHYPFDQWRERSLTEHEYPSSHYRYNRIQHLLPSVRGIKDCWDILSDHQNFPHDSVCRHETTPDSPHTTYGALSVVEDETMYVALRNPCQIHSAHIEDGMEISF